MNAVEFQGVSKKYAIYDSPGDRLTELLALNLVKRHRDFLALDDVSFSVPRGETFCIIGQNGSGKSTLLQVAAGILQPSSGAAFMNGRVAALLELGAGFNPEFSGRDNVYLNGSILGLSTRQIEQRYTAIESFAEIGEFINQPVKTYSSGMVVRLAFAVAINVDADILLVDEALAVGDVYFRQRCMRKVNELRGRGVSILFVSHAVNEVRAVGDRALWLDQGRVAALGDPEDVVARYMAAMGDKDSGYRRARVQRAAEASPAPAIVGTIPHIDHRRGDGSGEVLGIGVFDSDGRALQELEPCSKIVVRISVRANEEILSPAAGFLMRNQLGLEFSGADTAREGCEMAPMKRGEVRTVDFSLELPELYPASFSFSPFLVQGPPDDRAVCDLIENAVALQMARSENQVYGYLHAPCRIEVNSRLRDAAVVEKSFG